MSFWTPEKAGKHPRVIDEAQRLYKYYALCDEAKLESKLSESYFRFGNYGPCSWKDILYKADLDDCLKPEFVEKALNVTTAQPAIGKGEFLFTAIFANVGFSKGAGDLIDLQTGKTAEVKGIAGVLGNGQKKVYKQMSRELIINLFRNLGSQSNASKFDVDTANAIKRLVGTDERKMRMVFEFLQNTKNASVAVTNEAVQLYKQTNSLLKTIAAMHLYTYLRIEKASYFIGVNAEQFKCFNAPRSVREAYGIIKNFEVVEWRIGKFGITISLKRS